MRGCGGQWGSREGLLDPGAGQGGAIVTLTGFPGSSSYVWGSR